MFLYHFNFRKVSFRNRLDRILRHVKMFLYVCRDSQNLSPKKLYLRFKKGLFLFLMKTPVINQLRALRYFRHWKVSVKKRLKNDKHYKTV